MVTFSKKNKFIILILSGAVGLGLAVTLPARLQKTVQAETSVTGNRTIAPTTKKTFHIATPEPVKAIYMTGHVAGIKDWREKLILFIQKTEVNSIVIDIKDYSGHISFDTHDEEIKKMGAEENLISNLPALIEQFHQSGIYTIARITVFQDPIYTQHNPQQAVQTHSGTIWKDRNKLSYVDPSAKAYWDYVVRLAKAAEAAGFDEINFDYVRFPTDGNMKDMVFPLSGPKLAKLQSQPYPLLICSTNTIVTANARTKALLASGNAISLTPKAQVLRTFFEYLHREMAPVGIPISADLFGMVLTNRDDLNIGQMLEMAAPYFDYIGPMIYPSHYPHGFKGYNNPAANPYEIVNFVLHTGKARLDKAGYKKQKLRPWLQDFNMGAVYDAAKIKAQKKGVYDAGLTSWMMWDPRNKYTQGGYDLESNKHGTSKP